MKPSRTNRLLKRLRPRRRPTLRAFALQLGVVLVLYFALAQLCAHARPLGSILGDAGAFLLVALRVFLLVFGAGWLAVRLWLWFSHPDFGLKPRRSARIR